MEGVPQSLLEAMAACRPVVATRVGGIQELVADGVSGMLVAPGSPMRLREALERLRGDQQLAAQLGLAARAKVEQDYDAAKTSRQMAELYRELLSGPRRKPSHTCAVSERL
jgi:glycosyltransferase involved in cell wall biosynthesis